VEEEQNGKDRAAYGTALLEELANQLTDIYGKSFSIRNLRYMRQFYKEFSIWNAVRSELSWTHYRILLKVDNENSREFYLNEAITGNWSTRQLERDIDSLYFERLQLSKDREALKLEVEKSEEIMQSGNIIKDPFVLEFLDVTECKNLSESD
jgi:predicted nuclease of restriction endonuclease-like (RecB) superfamily